MNPGPCQILSQLRLACCEERKKRKDENNSLYPSRSGNEDIFLDINQMEPLQPDGRRPLGDGEAIWRSPFQTRVLRKCEFYAESARQACDQIHQICHDLKLSDRSVRQFQCEKFELKSAEKLERELSQLLNSEGGLLCILQEELDCMTDLVRKSNGADIEKVVGEFSHLLDRHKQNFMKQHGAGQLYHCFSDIVKKWQEKLPEKLFWLGGLGIYGEPVIKGLNAQCDQFLHELENESPIQVQKRGLPEESLHSMQFFRQPSEVNEYDSFHSTPLISLSRSLKSFSVDLDPHVSLIGQKRVETPHQWEKKPLPDGSSCFIPVNIHDLNYYDLYNEPAFYQKDVEYLKAGKFRINTRAAVGNLIYTHEDATDNVDQKWEIDISINRDDLDRAYPIITAWIMNPETRVYSAKIINQDIREGETQTGQEVVLKLFENERFHNTDPAHWQEKLAELESTLKMAGIRSGSRPAPEKHKFDRKIKGSDFFYYRNAAIRVQESIDKSMKDMYQSKKDPVTNQQYYCFKPEYSGGKENYMPVILEQDFVPIPVERRHNPLAGIDYDYMSQVDLTATLKPEYADKRAFASQHACSVTGELPNLSLYQHQAFIDVLNGVKKYFPDITENHLKRLLLNPETGGYQELDRWFPPTSKIINYLTLQKADPTCFTDQGYYWFTGQPRFICYGEQHLPEGEARRLWLDDARKAFEADTKARGEFERLRKDIDSLLPGGDRFEHFKNQTLRDVKIPDDLLDDYKNNIQEEVYLYLFHFGEPLGRDQLNYIFEDCTKKLTENLNPEETVNNSGVSYGKYNRMEFRWFKLHSHGRYSSDESPGFVAYQDQDAASLYAQRYRDEHNLKLADKFRISIHPHDYKKAWDIVAEVLSRNESPFIKWKAIPPWKTKVGIEQARLKIGGQFTLYSVDSPESKSVDRFKPVMIARVLQEIQERLRREGIRPGIPPRSDIDLGADHPFLSYRYDMDKEKKYYEPAALVRHQRLLEYRKMPRYQDVNRILNPADGAAPSRRNQLNSR